MKIIYWSQTGNTEKMADLIKKGIELEGKTAELVHVSSVNLEELNNEEIIIMGCPSYGSENLEEGEMEPFVASLEGKVNGKKIALFGSYGWGNGEWMNDWEERMSSYGGNVISKGLIINETPEDEDQECIEYGRTIAKSV